MLYYYWHLNYCIDISKYKPVILPGRIRAGSPRFMRRFAITRVTWQPTKTFFGHVSSLKFQEPFFFSSCETKTPKVPPPHLLLVIRESCSTLICQTQKYVCARQNQTTPPLLYARFCVNDISSEEKDKKRVEFGTFCVNGVDLTYWTLVKVGLLNVYVKLLLCKLAACQRSQGVHWQSSYLFIHCQSTVALLDVFFPPANKAA